MVKQRPVKTPSKADARFDSRHVRLRTGERQRENGSYTFRWTSEDGKRHAVYAPTLDELREQEEKVIVDKHDGVKTDVKKKTKNAE